MAASKTNVLIWRMFMASSMKAANHLGPNYLANLEVYKITNIEQIQSLFKITQKTDIGAFWRNSECEYDWQCISFMDEISLVSWSSDPVDKGKSTGLLWDSVLCMGKKKDSKVAMKDGKVNWKNDFRKRNIEREKLTDRITFMSMFNDIDWTRKGNDGICISDSEKVKEYAKRFL